MACLWWQEIAVLRKKYLSLVNPPPPQTMWPNCVSSKSERPQKMHLRLKIDFLILKTREGLALSYHYDMIIIADISHYRHYQRKCTFFKVVYFWVDITQKMLSRIYGVFFKGSNNAVVYRSCKILRMYPIRCLHIYTASTAYTVYTAIIAYTAYSVAYIPW